MSEIDELFREIEEEVTKDERKTAKEEPVVKKPEVVPVEETVPEKETVQVKPEAVKEGEFMIEEEQPDPKLVILIYGDKGVGKTMQAFSFRDEIVCLSFDGKSLRVKTNKYDGDKRIHIYDAVKHMDYTSPRTMTESASKTFDYINAIIDHISGKNVDWVVIDGSDIFQQVCEFTMRYRNNIGAFDGIANLNLWKERRALMRLIHNRCLNAAKKGIIYTTYTEKDDIIVDGELVTRKDVPKWIDVLMFATDVVLHVYQDPIKRAYLVKVITSKDDRLFPSGRLYDVTDKRLWDMITAERR